MTIGTSYHVYKIQSVSGRRIYREKAGRTKADNNKRSKANETKRIKREVDVECRKTSVKGIKLEKKYRCH